MPLFFLNYEQLLHFETKAWYFSFAGRNEATRRSASDVHEALLIEIEKRRQIRENFNNLYAL